MPRPELVTAPVPVRARRTAAPDDAADAACNTVHLVGRVSAAPQERELPSGDLLVAFRVVVDRPPARRGAPDGVRTPTVDALACVAWPARTRRAVLALQAGDVVEVRGALRQRFWRAGGTLGSRTEVEAEQVRRVRRAEDVAAAGP